METNPDQEPAMRSESASTAALSLAGFLALLSASCCVLPIGLSILGIGGSWLALLGPFAANRTYILMGVGSVIALAWLRVLSRHRCDPRYRVSFIAAASASALFVFALSAPLWEQSATRFMFEHWILAR